MNFDNEPWKPKPWEPRWEPQRRSTLPPQGVFIYRHQQFKFTDIETDHPNNNKNNHGPGLFAIGSTEFYILIVAVLLVTILLSWMVWYFFFKQKSILMQRNRRAQVRPISRRVVRKPTNTVANAPIETPTEIPRHVQLTEINERPGAYSQVHLYPSPVVNDNQPVSTSEPPPAYKDVITKELNYAELGWNIDPR